MLLRTATPADYQPIISVLNSWFGGRQVADKLPKLFFDHFHKTSFVAEENGQILGFVMGFLSPASEREAYIHFVGVHPDHRKHGLARTLYNRFFEVMREHKREMVSCVTSPINRTSIAYHTRMGFNIDPAGAGKTEDGIPYHIDWDGPGEHRVKFVKRIE